MDFPVKAMSFAFPSSEQLPLLMLSKIKVCPRFLHTMFVKAFLGKHYFSWAVMPHEGHFLESDVPIAGYLYNSPLRRKFAFFLSLFVLIDKSN
jgi:hypothetical protein